LRISTPFSGVSAGRRRRRRAGRRAQGRDGVDPARSPVQRTGHAASRQHRHAVPV